VVHAAESIIRAFTDSVGTEVEPWEVSDQYKCAQLLCFAEHALSICRNLSDENGKGT
jgi:hypothetical protein